VTNHGLPLRNEALQYLSQQVDAVNIMLLADDEFQAGLDLLDTHNTDQAVCNLVYGALCSMINVRARAVKDYPAMCWQPVQLQPFPEYDDSWEEPYLDDKYAKM